MFEPRYRSDQHITPDGQFLAFWGLEIGDAQYLLAGFSLPDNPALELVRNKEGVTHEFHLWRLCDAAPIDWERSMFSQPHLKPLQPAKFGLQVRSCNNAKFAACMQRRVELLFDGRLSAEKDIRAVMFDKNIVTTLCWKRCCQGGFFDLRPKPKSNWTSPIPANGAAILPMRRAG
jgi:hypothetical protein